MQREQFVSQSYSTSLPCDEEFSTTDDPISRDQWMQGDDGDDRKARLLPSSAERSLLSDGTVAINCGQVANGRRPLRRSQLPAGKQLMSSWRGSLWNSMR